MSNIVYTKTQQIFCVFTLLLLGQEFTRTKISERPVADKTQLTTTYNTNTAKRHSRRNGLNSSPQWQSRFRHRRQWYHRECPH